MMKRFLLLLTMLVVFPVAVAGNGGGLPITKVFLNVYTVYESDFIQRGASDEVFLFASCDLGDVAISGGYSFGGEGIGSPQIAQHEVTITATGIATFLQDAEQNPNAPPDSWYVHASSSPDFPDTTHVWTLHVTVNCARNHHPKGK
jgi:hypothetical protein